VRLTAEFEAEEVQLYYQIAVHGRNELGLAPDEYAGFSMTLLRMLAFRPGIGGADGQPAAAPGSAALSRPAAVAAARAAAGGSAAGAPPARAAANVQASHASITPQAVIAGAAAMARHDAPPSRPVPAMAPPAPALAPAPVPAPVPTAPAAPMPAPAASGPISPARAAINAALEAARAGSRPGGRSSAPAAASVASAAPAAATPVAPTSTQYSVAPAPAPPQAPAAYAAPAAPAAAAPARPAPWEDLPPGADAGGDTAVLEAPVRQAAPVVSVPPPAAQPAARQAPPDSDDDMPSWVTEFSDDSAIAAPSAAPVHAPAAYASAQPAAQAAPGYGDEQQIVMPARAAPAPSRAPYPYVMTPVPALDWDGNWPAVAALLPLRGVAQQLAMQAELINCSSDGNAVVFNLRVPIETWRTPGNVEKLTAALAERFGRAVRVDTELGAVWYTASAEAQAFRAACLKAAEETVANDPFVNSLLREFDAWVVPGSIVPPQPQAAA